MTLGRAARLCFLLGALAAPLVGSFVSSPASAAPEVPAPASPSGHVLMFVVDGVSVPEALAVPEFRQLARAGGLGLMTTNVTAGATGRRSSAYLTIGAGTRVSDPASSRAELMAQALTAAGVPTCAAPEAVPLSYIGDGACGTRPAGTGSVTVIGLQAPAGTAAARRDTLRADAAAVRRWISALGNARTLVMLVVPVPSTAMIARADEVTPLIMAEGPASGLLPPNGRMHALTSDSTRQRGVVANTDVAPTVLGFFDVAVPAEMDGSAIRPTGAPAPVALYRIQLDYRRIRFPVQLFELAVVVLAGLAAIGCLLWLQRRPTLSAKAAARWRFLGFAGAAFPLAVLSGGLLPRLTYPAVIGWLVVVPVIVAVVAVRVRWPGPYPAFGFIGALGLALIALDLFTGSHALRLPLEGGVMFDGARFFGLPNFAISPLLASALFVAVGLSTGWGTGVLVAAALLAGWPSLGADVGGSITLFAAAGLWFAIRRSGGTLRASGAALAAAVTVVGLGVVLLASRFAGTPTHATRFVERTGSRAMSALATIGDRLWVGARLVARDPAVLLPLIGLVVILWLVVRRPGILRRGLTDARWRDMIGVLAAAALVSYVVNDTGSTAAAPAFLYAMVAVLVPTVTALTDGGPQIASMNGAPPGRSRPEAGVVAGSRRPAARRPKR